MEKDTDLERKIGRQIQNLRKAAGYTQQQFAEMVGLSTNYFSDIERGKSFPRPDKLVLIINTLQCSADDVFSDVIDTGYRAKATRLSGMIDKLSKENRELIFALLDVLIEKLQ